MSKLDKLLIVAWILMIPYVILAAAGYLGLAWIFGIPVLLYAVVLYFLYSLDAPPLWQIGKHKR